VITTFQQHILQQQTPGASGGLSWLLSGITLATKMIESKIRCAALSGVMGSAGETNVQARHSKSLMSMRTTLCFIVSACATVS